jgi:hypothetical protein
MCREQLMPEAREIAQRMDQCLERHRCTDLECAMSQCPQEAEACGLGGAPIEGSCGSAFDCVTNCNADDACRRGCVSQASPEAAEPLAAVLRCDAENRCAMDFDCLNRSCGESLHACFGGGEPPPGLACIDFVACRLGCEGEPGCITGCRDQLAPEAREAGLQIDRCMDENNCRDLPSVTQNCPEQARACGLDGGGEPLNCAGVAACFVACDDGDMQCAMNCFGRARPQSREVVDRLRGCMMQNNCNDMPCAERSCGAQYRACLADR